MPLVTMPHVEYPKTTKGKLFTTRECYVPPKEFDPETMTLKDPTAKQLAELAEVYPAEYDDTGYIGDADLVKEPEKPKAAPKKTAELPSGGELSVMPWQDAVAAVEACYDDDRLEDYLEHEMERTKPRQSVLNALAEKGVE